MADEEKKTETTAKKKEKPVKAATVEVEDNATEPAEEETVAKPVEDSDEKAEQDEAKEEAKDDTPKGPSKMPDLAELGRMAKTFFGAVKTGVTDIIKDYKAKRATTETSDTKEK